MLQFKNDRTQKNKKTFHIFQMYCYTPITINKTLLSNFSILYVRKEEVDFFLYFTIFSGHLKSFLHNDHQVFFFYYFISYRHKTKIVFLKVESLLEYRKSVVFVSYFVLFIPLSQLFLNIRLHEKGMLPLEKKLPKISFA